MKYKISCLERGETSTGKKKATATLIGEDGKQLDVTIWGDFPNFAELMPGSEIEGELRPSSDPKYKPSLSPPRVSKTGQGGGYKAQVVEKAMERKESGIARFQASKEESIKIASTFTAAWTTAIAVWQEQCRNSSSTVDDIRVLFERWRKFYWENYDVTEANGNPKFPPFN